MALSLQAKIASVVIPVFLGSFCAIGLQGYLGLQKFSQAKQVADEIGKVNLIG